MSILLVLNSLICMGIFLSSCIIATVLLVPIMAMSLFFATGTVVCGFFSSALFKLGQRIYCSATFYSRQSLRSVADQIPLSNGKHAPACHESRPSLWIYNKLSHLFQSRKYADSEPIIMKAKDSPTIDLKVLSVPHT
ncbi:LADA_0F00782g1_1 [Lachancea dasiensis]|uniref:Outer spore wall protein 5 n=1 Tax=Lachancea dasiensis TaxID=1072105 RepID=A0A1G4JHU2_9SACH|nr:LADA_0F00782g1_1 [Lachancea dasiensis]